MAMKLKPGVTYDKATKTINVDKSYAFSKQDAENAKAGGYSFTSTNADGTKDYRIDNRPTTVKPGQAAGSTGVFPQQKSPQAPYQPAGTGAGTGTTGTGTTGTGTTGTPTGGYSTGANVGGQSVSDILSDVGVTDEFTRSYYDQLRNTATGEIDEEAIRRQKQAEYQQQLDAINSIYADKLNQARVQGQGRIGSSTALQARSGLLGSDFGQAQTAGVQQQNTEIENLVEQERLAKVAEIMSEIRTNAADEIAKKRLAKETGAKDYIAYLAGEPERKKAAAQEIAKRLIAAGLNPNDIPEEDLKARGISRSMLSSMYQEAQAAAQAAALKASQEQETYDLTKQKTQAEIDKLEREASKNYEVGGNIYNADGEKIGTKIGNNYEAGGNIYEAGTNKFLGKATKPGETPSTTITPAPAGNIITTKLNNGQTITTGSNVANALQIAVSTIPGIKFDAQNAHRTADDQARLYGKGRTAEELTAAGVNPAYAQPNLPKVTWTLQSKHMSGNAIDVVVPAGQDKIEYLNSIEAQMNAAGFVRPPETMAQGDYGHFEYVGKGLDDKAKVLGLTQGLGGTEGERAAIQQEIINKARRDGISLQEAKKALGYKSGDDVEFAKSRKEEYQSLRKSTTEQTKQAKTTLTLLDQPQTAVGDVATIVGFLKTIDPSSVARESEVESVESARSILDGLSVQLAKLKTGTKLSAEQRTQLKNSIKTIVDAAQAKHDSYLSDMIQEFDERGLDASIYIPKNEITRLKKTTPQNTAPEQNMSMMPGATQGGQTGGTTNASDWDF